MRKLQGFPRQARVHTKAQYAAVFQRPHRFSVDYLVALCRQNDQRHARLGISVSKKNFKLATDRNAVKRVIRESFRRNQSGLGSLDIVIVVKKIPSTFSKSELREWVERLWRKVERQFAGA